MLQSMAAQDQDPRNLHDLAVDAQTDIQKLATGLAHAGANPQAVQQLTKMAEVLSQVVKVLGEGQQAQAAQAGPPQGSPQAAAGPPPAQAGPPQGAPPPEAAAQPPGQAAVHHSIHSATHALHAAMVASAASRRAQ